MKQVGIAEFKAHLSKYLRLAKAGGVITITDRGAPVASLGPTAARNGLAVRPARGRLSELPPPPPNDVDFDVVELLLQTRQNWR